MKTIAVELIDLIKDHDRQGILDFIGSADKVRFWKNYLDAYHPNQGYGKFIHDVCKCSECGNLSINLRPKPLCGSCGFSIEMDKIEFAKPLKASYET